MFCGTNDVLHFAWRRFPIWNTICNRKEDINNVQIETHIASLCYRAVSGFCGADKWSGGVLLNVYSAGGPCPGSWLWPVQRSWWRDPGVWTDSRCPPFVLAKCSCAPLLHSERTRRSQHLQYLLSSRVFTQGLRAEQTSLPANKQAPTESCRIW